MSRKKRHRVVYADVAATAVQKPAAVWRAMERYAKENGASPGRGTYLRSIRASEKIYETRALLAGLFGVPRPERLVFTKNATEACNAALKGLLRAGDHVVVSGLEHNAVMRPLNKLKKERGIEWTVVLPNDHGRLNPYDFEKALRPKTRLVCVTHASNVTGALSPIEEIGEICSRRGVFLFVDAAQTAGVWPIDVRRMNIDLLAFTGHKGLMGPPGTGGLAVSPRVALDSLLEGGTGSNSDHEEQPDFWPDKMEAGTPNTWGIVGLHAAATFLKRKGILTIQKREERLVARFLREVQKFPQVRVFGPADERNRVAVVSLHVEGMDPVELGFRLDQEYGIQVRAGLHCAPLAHRSLGTYPTGTVRFSFGFFNTEVEIDYILSALYEVVYGR